MNIRKWIAELLVGKDPVDDKIKEKAEAAMTHFELTKEDIEREKAKVRRRDTEQRKIRKEKITEIDEGCKKVSDTMGSSRKEKALSKEEGMAKLRKLGWA